MSRTFSSLPAIHSPLGASLTASITCLATFSISARIDCANCSGDTFDDSFIAHSLLGIMGWKKSIALHFTHSPQTAPVEIVRPGGRRKPPGRSRPVNGA